MSYWVYIVRCKDDTFYTGYTNSLVKRIDTHNKGKGAKYTRGRSPVVMEYAEKFESKSDALKREYQIKQMSRKEKNRLMRGYPKDKYE